MPLELRNPHAVLAALHARPGDVQAVRLATPRPGGAWGAVADLAARAGVSVTSEPAERPSPPPRQRRDRGGRRGERPAAPKEAREGASHALVDARRAVALDTLFEGAGRGETGGRPGRWLALDSVQDPRNVGAIVRTAGFFGVRGMLLTRDRTAPLTAVTYDTASGGMETVPFALEPNLRRALDRAREAGLWILGSSERAATAIADVPPDRPWLLVVGNEERGLRRLTIEACDELCRIPSPGLTDAQSTDIAEAGAPPAVPSSLNVSVATGVMLAMLARPVP